MSKSLKFMLISYYYYLKGEAKASQNYLIFLILPIVWVVTLRSVCQVPFVHWFIYELPVSGGVTHQVWLCSPPLHRGPCHSPPLISSHLVLTAETCLTGHLRYLRSCQKAGKIWEDFKNLAELAFSRIILYDTFILFPNLRCLIFFFFHCWNEPTRSLGRVRKLWKYKNHRMFQLSLNHGHLYFQIIRWQMGPGFTINRI